MTQPVASAGLRCGTGREGMLTRLVMLLGDKVGHEAFKELLEVAQRTAKTARFRDLHQGEKVQQFYARINNSTQGLTGRDLIEYQRKRWPE